MKQRDIICAVRSLAYEELSEADRALVDAAKEATRASYAPYSHYHVGAAARLASGAVVPGANQENASFSATMCAERAAAFAAASRRPGDPIEAIAIAAFTGGAFQREPIPPCGVCRQALLEFETRQKSRIRLLLYGADCIYELPSVASTLPLSFTSF